jgi:hypothetical protein
MAQPQAALRQLIAVTRLFDVLGRAAAQAALDANRGLTRQFAHPHQHLIDRAGRLAAFADRPDDQ